MVGLRAAPSQPRCCTVLTCRQTHRRLPPPAGHAGGEGTGVFPPRPCPCPTGQGVFPKQLTRVLLHLLQTVSIPGGLRGILHNQYSEGQFLH